MAGAGGARNGPTPDNNDGNIVEKPVEPLEDGQNNLAIARTVLEDASKTDRLQLENRPPIESNRVESNLRWIFTMIETAARSSPIKPGLKEIGRSKDFARSFPPFLPSIK